jgi:hypothetical protein
MVSLGDFDSAVRAAKIRAGIEKEPEPIPVPRLGKRPAGIFGVCRFTVSDAAQDIWPNYFVELPRPGDYIISSSGRRLVILTVAHKLDENQEPMIELEIGPQKMTEVSPVEGGGYPT